jgi:hypothetical protein
VSLGLSRYAIFIKLNRLGLVEKCYEGGVFNKKLTEGKVWFEFMLKKVVECPPQYQSYKDGWYVDETA